MFGQVVRGRTTDAAAVRAALEGWSPGPGWLGTTAGVTDDGEVVAVVTHESAGAASLPPWEDVLDGPVKVTDGLRTEVFSADDTTRAAFVQVVQGEVTDLEEAMRFTHEMEVARKEFMPCLLRTVTLVHPEGRFTRVLAFTTEEEARAGVPGMPAHLREREVEVVGRLLVGTMTYLELRDPWVLGPV